MMPEPELLTTKEMAALLKITPETLRQWAAVYGAPQVPRHFPPGGHHGGGLRRTGWDKAKLLKWGKESGRMDDAGKVIPAEKRTKFVRSKPDGSAPAPASPPAAPAPSETQIRVTEGMAKMALARLLKAFAWSCQQPGCPAELYDELEDAGIEKLSQESLDIITLLASEDNTRDYQWQIILTGLPHLLKVKEPDPEPAPAPPPPPAPAAAPPAPAEVIPPQSDEELQPAPKELAGRITTAELAQIQEKLLAAITNLDMRIRIITEPPKI